VLGFTFKENVPDIRNSKAVDIVRELESFGMQVQVTDPLADPAEAWHEHRVKLKLLDELIPGDAVVLAVAHQDYLDSGWNNISRLLEGTCGVVMDIRSKLDRSTCPKGIELWRM
jgi:UDP-N-acetyl-D-galactosamine dehydrogenase